jgi:pyridinium-3,5-biscarboxylic acid mononucleotide sulfurtransferase
MKIIEEKIEEIIMGIKQASNNSCIVVAFSGGLDSTVVLNLARLAIGNKKLIAINVDFGIFTYNKARENINKICKSLGIKLDIIPGEFEQMEIMKGGPDCNLCTRKVKLGLIKKKYCDCIILTGSNKSDSWGQYGFAFSDGYYAPLFACSKKDIKGIANYLHIKIHRIGENKNREGCKLKHLLKPLINLSYHGRAVAMANELLLEQIRKSGIYAEKANVKIIGTLSKNIALINIYPLPGKVWLDEVRFQIEELESIDRCLVVDHPLELVIKANKGQFNNLRSRYWLEKGRLQPEFAFPIKVKWLLTTNRKLKTFQVVDYNNINKSNNFT